MTYTVKQCKVSTVDDLMQRGFGKEVRVFTNHKDFPKTIVVFPKLKIVTQVLDSNHELMELMKHPYYDPKLSVAYLKWLIEKNKTKKTPRKLAPQKYVSEDRGKQWYKEYFLPRVKAGITQI